MTLYKATAEGQIPMTPEEEAEFEASRVPTNQQINSNIIAKIALLEFAQPRAQREATLFGDMTRLKELDDQIAQLRSQLLK